MHNGEKNLRGTCQALSPFKLEGNLPIFLLFFFNNNNNNNNLQFLKRKSLYFVTLTEEGAFDLGILQPLQNLQALFTEIQISHHLSKITKKKKIIIIQTIQMTKILPQIMANWKKTPTITQLFKPNYIFSN